MVDPVLDVGVIMCGCGKSNQTHFQNAAENIMDAIRDEEDWRLAMDDANKILQEYESKLTEFEDYRIWIQILNNRGKVHIVRWLYDRKLKVALDNLHLDMKDRRYVVAACSSCCNTVVTIDRSSFTTAVCRKIKKKRYGRVRVMDPKEFIEANPIT